MSYPINYPTPQGANVQIFKEGGSTSDWVKPQGASFVWFTLIGSGGGGTLSGGAGGGSAAVTNCMVPAFLIPDILRVNVARGTNVSNAAGSATTIVWHGPSASDGYTLLTANGGGNSGAAGTATASNYFSCMGFYQSAAGQAGAATTVSPSATTFLTGGSGDGSGSTPNYGYPAITAGAAGGYFQMQPIIVGASGGGNGPSGIGCGGSGGGGSNKWSGDGLVVIITW